jgi:hypothetical protein
MVQPRLSPWHPVLQVLRTPFDPQSLDLSSIGALVEFYHACLGFPVNQTWLDAIKASNCDTFEGLTYPNAAKYCLDAYKTIMGHLAQQRQNVRLTKPKQPTPALRVVLSNTGATPSSQVFVMIQPLSKLFTNDTGRFPVRAHFGSQYVMIAFHTDGNLILQQAFNKTKSDCHHIAVYNAIMTCLAAQGLSVDLQILDKKASSAYKEAITFKWNATFQLVPHDMHHSNRAERTIRTFKNHFLAILAGVDAAFPPYLWDLLLPGTSQTHPQSSSSIHAQPSDQCMGVLSGAFRFQQDTTRSSWLSGPHPCKPATRRSWDSRAKNGFYIGPDMDSYRCFKLGNGDTKSQVISDTPVVFCHFYVSVPSPSTATEDRIIHGLQVVAGALAMVRCHPHASPRSKPLPTFMTSLNHGICLRLHPSSHLKSLCLVVQGCPHRSLQGWYCLYRQHRPT